MTEITRGEDCNHVNSPPDLVKLLRFSVFFIRSCLQVWFGHLFLSRVELKFIFGFFPGRTGETETSSQYQRHGLGDRRLANLRVRAQVRVFQPNLSHKNLDSFRVRRIFPENQFFWFERSYRTGCAAGWTKWRRSYIQL